MLYYYYYYFVLRKISGLGKVKAHKIVEWRNVHGPFLNRAQLKAIKGLGPKAFEQCAGFVRVLPGTRASCTETYVQVHRAVLWKFVQHIVQSKQYYYLSGSSY